MRSAGCWFCYLTLATSRLTASWIFLADGRFLQRSFRAFESLHSSLIQAVSIPPVATPGPIRQKIDLNVYIHQLALVALVSLSRPVMLLSNGGLSYLGADS